MADQSPISDATAAVTMSVSRRQSPPSSPPPVPRLQRRLQRVTQTVSSLPVAHVVMMRVSRRRWLVSSVSSRQTWHTLDGRQADRRPCSCQACQADRRPSSVCPPVCQADRRPRVPPLDPIQRHWNILRCLHRRDIYTGRCIYGAPHLYEAPYLACPHAGAPPTP
jgi:hypothetical protein